MSGPLPPRKPDWLKVRLPAGKTYQRVGRVVREHRLHTVCQSAACPNIGECWGCGTATLMILGDTCSRHCGFCAVGHGSPGAPDLDEPRRVAEAVALMGLRHAVITSVTRDDLPDGGARIWAETIARVRARNPDCRIEVLIPDLQGDREALDMVLSARPDILGHNLETVPRLYPLARPQADYARSLELLHRAAGAGHVTKTGLMLGIGETDAEATAALGDARRAGVAIATLGQYLCPTRACLPVARYVTPEAFEQLRRDALAMGFDAVESGPLVRSSYHAEQSASRVLHPELTPSSAPGSPRSPGIADRSS